MHLKEARRNWDSIGYVSYRYLFTYKHLINYYYENMNIDSVEHYFNLLNTFKRDNHPNSLNNVLQANLTRAWSYYSIGDIYKAHDIIQTFKSDSLFQKYPDLDKIWFLNSLGEIKAEIGKPKYLTEALEIHKMSIGFLNKIEVSTEEREYLYNLHQFGQARSYRLLNNHLMAVKLFPKLITYYNSIQNYQYTAVACSELAQSYFKMGNIKKAKFWFEKSIFYNNKSNNEFKFSVEPYVFLSQIFLDNGEFHQCESLAKKGLEISSFGKYTIGNTDSLESYKNPIYLIDILTILSKNYEMQLNLDTAKLIVEDGFKILHSLTPRHLDHKSKINLKSAQDELFNQIIHLERIDGVNEDLFFKIDRNKASILASDKNINSINRDLIKNTPIDISFIQFSHDNDSLYINCLKGKSIKTFSSEKEIISFLLKTHFSSVPNSHSLYSSLIAPLNIPKGSTITIIPDGELAHIPFGSLLTDPDDPTSFLEKDYTINYQLSATLMQQLEQKEVNTTGLAAFAPEFNDNPDDLYAVTRGSTMEDSVELYHLPYSADEVESISTTWDAPTYTVTKDNIIDALQNKRIFHFSGHAVTYNDDSDYSFLALSSDVQNLDDKLLLKELYNLECNNEMVVLSACETGTGEIAKGEGVLSLSRGFFYAGAKSVISTLWQVNDQSTSIIMKEFYRQLKKGKRKDRALQLAKLHYLDSVDPEYQDPKYWAGFIAVGDMSPLFDPWLTWKYAGAGVLGLGLLFLARKPMTRLF